MPPFYFAAPPASIAGMITATSTVIIAIGGLLTALSVALPLLRATRANTRQIAENQAATVSKLDIIHTLVNSTLTAAMQSELDATRREEMLLRELTIMRRDSGHPTTMDQTAALGAIERRIRELAQALADRKEQTRIADIQAEVERNRVVADAKADNRK